jgi:hypothetical protein
MHNAWYTLTHTHMHTHTHTHKEWCTLNYLDLSMQGSWVESRHHHRGIDCSVRCELHLQWLTCMSS